MLRYNIWVSMRKGENKSSVKIRVVEDYVRSLYDYFEGGIEYPLRSAGFNMSFIEYKDVPNIFVFRNVLPLKNLLERKDLVPGISKRTYKRFLESQENFKVENSDFSENFIWDWTNFYQTSILFAGKLTQDLKIVVDKNIEPYAFVQPMHCLQYKENGKSSCGYYFRNSEDLRLYTFKGRIYLIDSNVNTVYQVIVKKNRFNVFRKYTDICMPTINMNSRRLRSVSELDVEQSEVSDIVQNTVGYLKFFEKNWSLYRVKYSAEDKKEVKFMFFHDFSLKGVEGVSYNVLNGKCSKKILVSYPEKTFPIDTNIVRFSFGSTTTFFVGRKRKGYLGVGHVKMRLQKLNNSNKNAQEQHFYDLFLMIHKKYKEVFREKYKPHHVSQYSFFFFLYDEENKKFYISDMFLPVPKYQYFFSLVFPMSVVSRSGDIILSMGYGDYTNLFLSFDKDKVESYLIHDVSALDITMLKMELLF